MQPSWPDGTTQDSSNDLDTALSSEHDFCTRWLMNELLIDRSHQDLKRTKWLPGALSSLLHLCTLYVLFTFHRKVLRHDLAYIAVMQKLQSIFRCGTCMLCDFIS